jgi:dGTPase
VADLADEIAYTSHDLDDGLRSELLRPEDLEEVALWREIQRDIRDRLGPVSQRMVRSQTVVAMIDRLVTGLVESTASRLEASGVCSADDVQSAEGAIVAFEPQLEVRKRELNRFLDQRLYRHPRVLEANERAGRILRGLFAAYRNQGGLLPDHVRANFATDGEGRAISDYIAGMTDRFAIEEHRRLVDGNGC